MNTRHESAIWAVALLCSAFAIRRMVAPGADVAHTVNGTGGVARLPAPIDDDSLESLESTVTDGNLFRLARRPATATFLPRGARQQPGMMAPVMSPPKPALTLKAIIGGPPWQGVVEGMPGRDGASVLHAGDKVDRFTVRSITRDTVVIQAPDTTYRLTLTGRWQ